MSGQNCYSVCAHVILIKPIFSSKEHNSLSWDSLWIFLTVSYTQKIYIVFNGNQQKIRHSHHQQMNKAVNLNFFVLVFIINFFVKNIFLIAKNVWLLPHPARAINNTTFYCNYIWTAKYDLLSSSQSTVILWLDLNFRWIPNTLKHIFGPSFVRYSNSKSGNFSPLENQFAFQMQLALS